MTGEQANSLPYLLYSTSYLLPMSGITDEIIERVKHEANIVDVIGDYVRLRRTGKNWLGLCPFHEDKRPSMHVEPVKGIFKCFACGEGGNVFTFLMKLNNWTFPETVRNLAAQLNIEIPETRVERKDLEDRERYVSAVREAARRYHRVLRSPAGEHALAYFRGRGFTDETINRFGLGYSPEEWRWLLEELTGGGFTPEELEKSGLVLKNSKGSGWYDRFRGRAMFPIFEATGRLVGFGARRMNDDPDQPKYINSSDSPIYNKSRVLYGLFQAKDAIRKEGYALFVEGYADVISLHQAGVATAVATCGTSLAKEHAALITRYTNRVVLVFDSDLAGEKATERGIDVLIEGGVDVAVARLPDGEDPDTFIRRFGPDEFRRRIGEARSFLEFRAQLMQNRGDLDSPDRQTEAIRSLVRTIALIPDRLKRELFVNKLATDFHISEGLMFRELEQATGVANRRRERENRLPAPSSPPPIPEPGPEERGLVPVRTEPMLPAKKEKITVTSFPAAEFRLAQILSDGDPQMLEHTFERIDPTDFTHPLLREYVDLILAHYVNQHSFALEDLSMEELSPELRQFVAMLAVEQETISDFWRENDPDYREPNPWKVARDCLIRIRLERIEHDYQHVQDRLHDPDLTEQEIRDIFMHLSELGNLRRELNGLISGE